MSNIKLRTDVDSLDLEAAITEVVNGESDDFLEIAQTLGLNPLTDFKGRDLRGITLKPGSILNGANLRSANLEGASLVGVLLKRAKLTGAKLVGADLRGADRQGADLSGADFTNVDLSGADLSQIITTPKTKLDNQWLEPELSLSVEMTVTAALKAEIDRFIIFFNEPTNTDLVVGFTVSGTVTEGADYQSIGRSLAIAKGTTIVVIPARQLVDPLLERLETVELTLLSGAGYALNANKTATVTFPPT